MNTRRLGLSLTLIAGLAGPAAAEGKLEQALARHAAYRQVVAKTAAMVNDPAARQLAARHGLSVVNVMWEDTGRFKGSSVGPNISDVTIQVEELHPRTEQTRLTCMPVIRFPNFSDKTADMSPNRFFLLVGNQDDSGLKRIPLTEYLDNLRAYLNKPGSWKGTRTSLLAPRDHAVLVSAQACFLPVPKGDKATFNPVIFNYQSMPGDPAVLCILATREGTSATVIDNQRDSSAGGQRLFFNTKGKRAMLTGQRKSDFERAPTTGPAASAPKTGANGEAGLNMVLMIQVPLKQKPRPEPEMPTGGVYDMADCESAGAPMARASDVEAAVIGHGRVDGPYTELAELAIERDPRFPIRVTVQFYKATSNGVVSAADVAAIKAQIERVYDDADHVGSLVTAGETGRATEYEGPKLQPPTWWADFWDRYQQRTGQTREATVAKLDATYGDAWIRMTRNPADLNEAIGFAGGPKVVLAGVVGPTIWPSRTEMLIAAAVVVVLGGLAVVRSRG